MQHHTYPLRTVFLRGNCAYVRCYAGRRADLIGILLKHFTEYDRQYAYCYYS